MTPTREAPEICPHLRAILEDPADDAPRLVYADWLDERGKGERAEFVRVQVELAQLGPPHVVVTERCVLGRQYGPGYFTLTGGEQTESGLLVDRVGVGSRVDVLKPRGKRPAYGLRVHKVGGFERTGADSEIVLVEDDKSAPWDGTALRQRARAILVDFPAAPHWLGGQTDPLVNTHPHRDVPSDGPAIRCHGAGVREVRFDFRRGFAARLTCETAAFLAHARALFAAHPITTVRLTDREPYRTIGGGFGWHDEDDGGPGRLAVLPDPLWDRLEPKGGRRNYPTREAAMDALSAACVSYARSLAGLGPLP